MKNVSQLLITIWILALLPVLAAGDDNIPVLSVLHSIGTDEKDPILYAPIDLVWSVDGRAYVLNGGDNSIVAFAPNWKVAFTFAGQGEAPGELNMPSALEIIGSELWVKVPRGAVVFDLNGNFLRLQRFPLMASSLCACDDGLFGIATFADGIGAHWSIDGELLGSFGPTSPEIRDIETIVRRTSWLAVPGAEGSCTLVDGFDGIAWVFYNFCNPGKAVDLDLGRGSFPAGLSFKKVVSDVCLDRSSGYFVISYPYAGSKGYLHHYDARWSHDGSWEFDPEMRPGMVRVSPDGSLCLIDEAGSALYLCENPIRESPLR